MMMNQDKLCRLENVIDKNRRRFYEIGSALKQIRDEKLYRISLFGEFGVYTKERWEIGKSQAYRLIEASIVIDNLSPIGERLPENESQARALASLSPPRQREIWCDFLQSGHELTARNLKKFINVQDNSGARKREDLSTVISSEYKKKALEMLVQIDLAQKENWRMTSRQAALLWNRVMKEKIMSKK